MIVGESTWSSSFYREATSDYTLGSRLVGRARVCLWGASGDLGMEPWAGPGEEMMTPMINDDDDDHQEEDD